jgi:uncharacterized protein (TIGR03118 family)
MKYRRIGIICSGLLTGFFLAAGTGKAQTRAYRQINLTGSATRLADNVIPRLLNPWGMTFLPGNPFFIANTNSGHVLAQPPAGSSVGLPDFIVGSPDNTAPGTPTGIVADVDSYFGSGGVVQPFILATEDGGVFYWGPDTNGDFPAAATLALDHSSSGAVYTGLAILTPDCCSPFLGVVNFHDADVETYTTTFSPLGAPGNFLDPDLPAGYAPFGLQVIGGQIFITYAVQDTARHAPVMGTGNGLVDVFDLEGNFVKRFVTGGELNAPWGVTKASANFGPFSNDILIGNAGDGIINAFDFVTGEFKGKIRNGNDNVLANPGLHALVFRNDGVGDQDTLYFTAGPGNGDSGLFGAISVGLVSTVQLSVPDTPTNTSATFSASVTPGPGNSGSPTGTVDFVDGSAPVGTAPVVDGEASLTATLTRVGSHVIEARYSGDGTFLPGSGLAEVHVTGPATTTTLEAPADAPVNSPVTLRATTSSASGIPTGSIDFIDRNDVLGTAPVNAAGVATLTISTLAPGVHTLVAGYSGDPNFESSVSDAVTITIRAGDFQLATTPPGATVTAGQSATFTVTVTPSGGFADSVNFSCQTPGGISCAFEPTAVNTASGAANTVLTVKTSSVAAAPPHLPYLNGMGQLSIPLILIGMMLLWQNLKTRRPRRLNLAWAAGVMFALTLVLADCGGAGQPMQPAPASKPVIVTAQSGPISHSTTVSITFR